LASSKEPFSSLPLLGQDESLRDVLTEYLGDEVERLGRAGWKAPGIFPPRASQVGKRHGHQGGPWHLGLRKHVNLHGYPCL